MLSAVVRSMSVILSTFLPFFLMVLSTTLVAKELISKNSSLQLNYSKYKKDVQLIKTLLAMDIFFLVCFLPGCIVVISDDLLKISYFGQFYYELLNALTVVYSALDFFIYFLSNKLFRKHFLSMFSCRTKKPIQRS